ncbi:hypothetical protein DFH09DRAFT_1306155 [Mycena vulgaris]|nr:hypothetical protein DFH09DRAFT_1306155 [Mycena vulgaris]
MSARKLWNGCASHSPLRPVLTRRAQIFPPTETTLPTMWALVVTIHAADGADGAGDLNDRACEECAGVLRVPELLILRAFVITTSSVACDKFANAVPRRLGLLADERGADVARDAPEVPLAPYKDEALITLISGGALAASLRPAHGGQRPPDAPWRKNTPAADMQTDRLVARCRHPRLSRGDLLATEGRLREHACPVRE